MIRILKQTRIVAALLFVSFVSVQCASVGTRTSSFKLRSYETATLTNGLQVLMIPDDSLPYFSMVMMIKTGSSLDPADKAGLANFTAGLLDKGTKTRSTIQIADALGEMGSDFNADVDKDYTVFRAGTLAQYQKELIGLFSDILVNPSFPQSEISRLKDHYKSRIKNLADDPSALASLAYEKFLYHQHPYGASDFGTIDSLNRMKKKDIIRYYLGQYRPNNSWLAVAGRYNKEELITNLNEAFKTWESRPVAPTTLPAVTVAKGHQITLVNKADLKQTQIRLGHDGIQRTNPDYLTVRVASTILGGAFSSRLMNEIRVKRGLTYGIYSSFQARKQQGPFVITTFTRNDKVAETVGTTIRVLETFKANGVTDKEVNMAKQLMKGQFPQSIQTPEALAENLLVLRYYGIDDSYISNFLNNVEKISTADVNRVIRQYFRPEDLQIVVFSPKSETEEQLKPFGPIENKAIKDVL